MRYTRRSTRQRADVVSSQAIHLVRVIFERRLEVTRFEDVELGQLAAALAKVSTIADTSSVLRARGVSAGM